MIGEVGEMETYQSANFILFIPDAEYRFVAVGRDGENSFQKTFLIGRGFQVVDKRQLSAHIVAMGINGMIYGGGVLYRHLTQ